MEYHPIANIFPLLQGEEFEALKQDIKQNGLLEPIWLHPDGRIIDGRNRHRACLETGVKPVFRTWDNKGSLVGFVLSLNLHRRHLNSGQRAAIAVEILPILEEEAKQRQGQRNDLNNFPQFFGESSNGIEECLICNNLYDADTFPDACPYCWKEKNGLRGQVDDLPNKIKQDKHSGEATQQAAQLLKTNRQYVSDAKTFKQEAPELFEQVKTGEKSLVQAKREFVKQTKVTPPPIPNKYRVIYADPPWKYGNSGLDEYGHAERHYPSMTITELCTMGEQIKEASETNAVLFMWVTSPFLEDCFKVINAWGFQYKTSFVWDKVKHNFGYYNSVRHEFLLVCTKGSCTPDINKLYDSVQSIERSEVHSEKPEEFRAIIDELYPNGNRIELFSRKQIANWDLWGNEKCSETQN